jgi:hypothetical protein
VRSDAAYKQESKRENPKAKINRMSAAVAPSHTKNRPGQSGCRFKPGLLVHMPSSSRVPRSGSPEDFLSTGSARRHC